MAIAIEIEMSRSTTMTRMMSTCLALVATAAAAKEGSSNKPHILLLLADDLGHSCIGYNYPKSVDPPEILTPTLDRLAQQEGLILTRHYSYKFCSPTRSALQSGRLPVHVNTENAEPEVSNIFDRVSGYAGIPTAMTGIAQRLQHVGYNTIMSGKWDAGMATNKHTPLGRGFNKALSYFHHANDYFNEGLPLSSIGTVNVCGNKYVDLWDTDKAANTVNGTFYEPYLFANHSLEQIAAHNISAPLFLFHAFHLVHTPLQVPADILKRFSFIDNVERKPVSAMVSIIDEVSTRLVNAFQTRGMWENTLAIFISDNGGAIYEPAGGNNFPFRGGKMSDWEGGIRTIGFVTGGFLPKERWGQSTDALFSVADWYTTLCGIGGGTNCSSDPSAAAANLPPIDGLDQWPVLNGSTTVSPRTFLHSSSQALVESKYKLVVGKMPMSGWTSTTYPNNTGVQPTFIPLGWEFDCGAGCLFDLSSDPTEHVDLAKIEPTVLLQMQQHLTQLNTKLFNPHRGLGDKRACVQAVKNGGFYGPWLEAPTSN